MTRRWFVQALGTDGVFHTVESHTFLSAAFQHYMTLDGVRQLTRGAHIVLRSDRQPTDSLF